MVIGDASDPFRMSSRSLLVVVIGLVAWIVMQKRK
jgi:hypothetical protein